MPVQLHYFNPGHETAILHGSENYTPPKNVQQMIQDLSCLPVWYAKPGDYVFADKILAPRFFNLQPIEFRPLASFISHDDLTGKGVQVLAMQTALWGITPQALRLFNNLKNKYQLNLSVPTWKEDYFRLTGRQTASECLEKIREELPGMDIPVAPKFCTKMREIEKYLILQRAPFVLKTPYSSSGRGLLWLPERKLSFKDRTWIEGAFSKQGMVSIEPALDKQQDFALEFYSDGEGNVRYEGISIFGSTDRGAYSGNILGSQKSLSAFLINKLGEETVEQIIEAVRKAIASVYGSLYTGYLGVDMLTYKKNNHETGIHPCIEVNMRYTMGMVAKQISERFLTPDARGDFRITYENKPGAALEGHRFMKNAYPLEFVNGKIKEGYLSLCPVNRETRYRAYILVL